MFQEQLGLDQGYRCVNVTPEELADSVNFDSFKITDKFIGSGKAGPRSHAVRTKSIRR